jgi:exosortase
MPLMGSPVAVRSHASDIRLSAWLTAAGISVLVIALYAEVLRDLALEWWTQPDASYGMLIPPLALYIAYLKRGGTLAVPAEPDSRGLVLIATGCLAFLTGKLAAEFFLTRISFVIVLAGLCWAFLGYRRTRALAFPLLLLFTMVPPPGIVYNTLSAPLQLLASKLASDIAQLLGVSIYRDGNIIYLATTSLGVAEACSGLRSLAALTVASLLLGFLENVSLMGRLLIVLLSAPLGIAVNVFRVTGTAILADYDPELALGYYHFFSGWLVFVIGFGLLWLTTKGIRRFSGPRG